MSDAKSLNKNESNSKMSPMLKEVYNSVAESYITIDVSIAEKEQSLITSKYGGLPYIPQGEDCLRDEHGYPYLLFAQFNFTELSQQAGQHSDLPQEGLLQIFLPIFNTEIFLHDKDFDTSKCIRFYAELPTQPANQAVINEIRTLWRDVESLWDANNDEYRNLSKDRCEWFEKKYPNSSYFLPFYKEMTLGFSQKVGHPVTGDIAFDRETEGYSHLTLSEEEWTFYEQMTYSTECNQVLGFGTFCQGDPRYVCDYPEGDVERLSNLRLFFQLTSTKYIKNENGKRYNIIPIDGEFQFFIDKEDLKNQKFHNMMFHFACT